MATRYTIDLEDTDEATAGGFGLWLDVLIREETDHTVHRLSYQRDQPLQSDDSTNG